MTATLISQTSDKAFTLTTETHTVEVYAGDSYLNVYAGKARLGHGRTFHQHNTQARLLAAIESYKAPAVKAALRALLCELA
jgi:hypothetical protein